MAHEPWVLVCPATNRPIRDRSDPAKPASQRVIPNVPIPRFPMGEETGRALIGRVIGDRYVVRSLIGEGGMGVVYEAEHLTIGRLVAVKVIHPKRAQDRQAIARLRHEARVAGTLGHPNICAIHDMGRLDDESPYLVMERLHGETLAQRLQREGRLGVEDLTDIGLQVLSALVATHQQGIVHRDLKPDNIFLSRREGMRPIPKLLDFGISKAEDIEDSLLDPGRSTVMGTPYYMAPEQARGDGAFDHRVDLWALGVVLYESLAGFRPFDAKNYNALLVQILTAAPRRLPELNPSVSPDLWRLIERALTKEPGARFQTAKEMQHGLNLAQEGEPYSQPRRFSLPDGDPQPISSKPASMIRELELAPIPSSKRMLRGPELTPFTHQTRRTTSREFEAQGVPSSRPIVPIIVDEPSNDDSDSTFVFSRVEMGLLPVEASRKKSPVVPKVSAAPTPPRRTPANVDEEEPTLVEGQNFGDSTTVVQPDKSPKPPPRKE
jgi:serine/threonine protein kinase